MLVKLLTRNLEYELHVHSARPKEGRVEPIDVVGRGKQKATFLARHSIDDIQQAGKGDP